MWTCVFWGCRVYICVLCFLSKYFVLAVQKFCQPARIWTSCRPQGLRPIFVMQKVFTICKAASWVLPACPANGAFPDFEAWPNRFLLILGISLERRSARGFYTCCRFHLSAFSFFPLLFSSCCNGLRLAKG